mmetsp:Transcript_16116/g.37241  ORF Transcript_16116/g.37241 Transcript_16116/m.37241 type:complete len:287 (-) Transcript_16116:557-1417(-)
MSSSLVRPQRIMCSTSNCRCSMPSQSSCAGAGPSSTSSTTTGSPPPSSGPATMLAIFSRTSPPTALGNGPTEGDAAADGLFGEGSAFSASFSSTGGVETASSALTPDASLLGSSAPEGAASTAPAASLPPPSGSEEAPGLFRRAARAEGAGGVAALACSSPGGAGEAAAATAGKPSPFKPRLLDDAPASSSCPSSACLGGLAPPTEITTSLGVPATSTADGVAAGARPEAAAGGAPTEDTSWVASVVARALGCDLELDLADGGGDGSFASVLGAGAGAWGWTVAGG